MSEVEARVATTRGGRYVRQLCAHWSHKLAVEREGDTGIITFVDAIVTLAADAAGLRITVAGAERADVARLKEVVAAHIDRFAFREPPLVYEWSWKA